ncbi:hypothetical protein FACS189499_02260 [Clostridia bacterium]|nr:hypothetical protein FACS189499_02260 [Clostridia bacterium]
MTTQISAEIKSDYKPMFYHTCERIGISPSTAISLFVQRMALIDAFPFDINEKIEVPNDITLASFAEADRMIKDGTGQEFSSLEAMREAMSEEDDEE